MLTRLRVKGFKNLLDADVSFGPFTCIAGANGVGKSNLFDAIAFLSDLTRYSIVEAAARVRNPAGKSGDIRALFYRSKAGYAQGMSLEAEFITPNEVVDGLGRRAKPAATRLRYKVVLRYREARGKAKREGIELVSEELHALNARENPDLVAFPCLSKRFVASVVQGNHDGKAFIYTTQTEDGKPLVHFSDNPKENPLPRKGYGTFIPLDMPVTLVGFTNTVDEPTIFAAHVEMQSWRVLHLEPSALREPDELYAEPSLDARGAHLPTTLDRLGEDGWRRIANHLATLTPEVRKVMVDADEKRRVLTLLAAGRDGVLYPARSLSDGALRFLALATIAEDPKATGLFCIEEPENGIHPRRVPHLVHLLQNLTVDTKYAVGKHNPLRQVIINTHSPAVVAEVSKDSLLMAIPYQLPERQGGGSAVKFVFAADTWRSRLHPEAYPIPLGELISYLDIDETGGRYEDEPPSPTERVLDYVEEQKRQLEAHLRESEAA